MDRGDAGEQGRWAVPPRAKIYEALGAVADARVTLTGPTTAEVTSSSGDKTYSVTWSPDMTVFSSNDNASYWRRYAGYPIIAVLLVTGRLPYDAGRAKLLAGVPWKRLNDDARRDYDRVVDGVLAGVEERGGDRRALEEQAKTIHERFAALELRRGPRLAAPRRHSRAGPDHGRT